MKNLKLSPVTNQIIKDLQDDLEDMLSMNSDIEVIWKLENLANNDAIQKSANYIRKALSQQID